MKTKKVTDEFKVGKNKIGFISSSFVEEFGNEKIEKGKVLSFQKLPRAMSDSEIISELKVQECTLGDVLATINSSIEGIKDGYSNIFYIKNHSRVVSVGWYGDGWIVFDWGRGDDWSGGGRVFSPATGSGKLRTMGSDALTLENAIKICKENGLEVIKKM